MRCQNWLFVTTDAINENCNLTNDVNFTVYSNTSISSTKRSSYSIRQHLRVLLITFRFVTENCCLQLLHSSTSSSCCHRTSVSAWRIFSNCIYNIHIYNIHMNVFFILPFDFHFTLINLLSLTTCIPMSASVYFLAVPYFTSIIFVFSPMTGIIYMQFLLLVILPLTNNDCSFAYDDCILLLLLFIYL